MANVPSGISGVNNYSASEPRTNTSAQSSNLGAPIKTTVMPAQATFAGHGQVNPGSKKGNSAPVGNYAPGLTSVQHKAVAIQSGAKETGKRK